MPKRDPELDAIAAILGQLSKLPLDAQRRIVWWLEARLTAAERAERNAKEEPQ